jgi:hypothetical protein
VLSNYWLNPIDLDPYVFRREVIEISDDESDDEMNVDDPDESEKEGDGEDKDEREDFNETRSMI